MSRKLSIDMCQKGNSHKHLHCLMYNSNNFTYINSSNAHNSPLRIGLNCFPHFIAEEAEA